jgi:hypothetical protein
MFFNYGTSIAQSDPNWEGEITTNLTSMQDMKSSVKTKNILAKMILKNVMKKIENNGYYTGTYTTTTIVKGKSRYKVFTPYNNSYMIVEKNGDMMKTTTYYPGIKKGYYTTTSLSANKQQLEEMRKGKIEKTGETMTLLGRKCEVYRVKYEVKNNADGTNATTIMNNDYAIYLDPAEDEILPDIKGIPLKYINNTVSQSTNEMLDLDYKMYLASETVAMKERAVDMSEVSVPSDIKLIDADKNQKGMLKIIEENMKYLKKNNMWKEKTPDEIKIYDNLQEDWEY